MRKFWIVALLAACGGGEPDDGPDARFAPVASCTSAINWTFCGEPSLLGIGATFACDGGPDDRHWVRLGVVVDSGPLIYETTYACGESIGNAWEVESDTVVITGGALARDENGTDFGCEAQLPQQPCP